MVILAPFSDKVPMACKKQVAPIIKLDSFFCSRSFLSLPRHQFCIVWLSFNIFFFIQKPFQGFFTCSNDSIWSKQTDIYLEENNSNTSIWVSCTLNSHSKNPSFFCSSSLFHIINYPTLNIGQGMTFFRNNSLVKKYLGLNLQK